MLQLLSYLCGSILDLVPVSLYFSYIGECRTGHITELWTDQSWAGGKDLLPWIVCIVIPSASQKNIGLLHRKGTVLAYGLIVHQDPVVVLRTVLQPINLRHVLVQWDYSSLGAGLGISICWSSLCSHWPNSPACPGCLEWQNSALLSATPPGFVSSVNLQSALFLVVQLINMEIKQ